MTTPHIQTGLNYQGSYPTISYHKQGNPTGWIPVNAPTSNAPNYDMKKIGKAALFLIGELAVVYLAFKFGHFRGWDTGFDAGWDGGKNFGKTEAEQLCSLELSKQYAGSLVTLIRTVEGIIYDANHR